MEKLNITQHCCERYAERIMGRDNCDIAVYVEQHKSKIETDVNKLYEFGELIYTGALRDKNYVNVYLNGCWVLIVDKDCKRAITLYKIEFGLGEEFNKDFISKMMEQINVARDKYCETLKEIEEQKQSYVGLVNELTEKVSEYRKLIKNMEKQIESYNEIIKLMDGNAKESEENFRQSVARLVCKREF